MNNLYWLSFAGYGHISNDKDESIGVVITFAPNPQAALDHALTMVPVSNYKEVEAAVIQLEIEDIVRYREDQLDVLLSDPAELEALDAARVTMHDMIKSIETLHREGN